jgi:hypothetical protein
MDIQDFIQKKCGVLLPIKGGDGQSKETAVILTLKSSYYLIQVQNDFISYWIESGKWRKINQSLIEEDKKILEKITIHHIDDDDFESFFTFWFDVSECLL